MAKTNFGKYFFNVLVFLIASHSGISPLLEKMEGINNFKAPTMKQLWAQILRPLTDILTDIKYCDISLSYGALVGFNKIKLAPRNTIGLSHDPN